jgi:hypothetical protein
MLHTLKQGLLLGKKRLLILSRRYIKELQGRVGQEGYVDGSYDTRLFEMI